MSELRRYSAKVVESPRSAGGPDTDGSARAEDHRLQEEGLIWSMEAGRQSETIGFFSGCGPRTTRSWASGVSSCLSHTS